MLDRFAQIFAGQFRQVRAVVPQGNHPDHIIVDGSSEDAADDDPDVGDRSVKRSHYRSENRTCPGNIQQFNDGIF
ncbi:hypothetical protein SDC9_170363 [bioreactor metagenome]|uniref:Uncharacterized protein n=1 Tax=bioreactor metagenome TaxID=1076179 RepID=A0A645G7W4_9ZZZZ